MKPSWKEYKRHDGKQELECEHGVGHGGIHGCCEDRCCTKPEFKEAWKKVFGRPVK